MMREVLIYLSRSRRLARFVSTNRLAWAAASRFIAGQTIDDAINVIRGYHAAGLLTTLDHLGESVNTRAEADQAAQDYLDAIDRIEQSGVKTHISLKLTSMGLDIEDALAEANLRRIVARAGKLDPPMFVRVDMEGSPHTQRTLDVFHRVRADFEHVGIVLQSALYRTAEDVEKIITAGAWVRLCKGAYLEPPSIAYPKKADVDAAYLRLSERMLSDEARATGVYLASATHDEKIIEWTKRYATEHGIGKDQFEFQMLNGVRRDLQARLVAEGYRMRVYVPYGTHWYPYYMRRLAERPENLAFMVKYVLAELRP
jgi:proline dehydrogenase